MSCLYNGIYLKISLFSGLGVSMDKLVKLRELRKKYIREKDWESALLVIERMIKISPHPSRFHKQGVVLIQLHRYDEALASFEKALKIDPGYMKAKI